MTLIAIIKQLTLLHGTIPTVASLNLSLIVAGPSGMGIILAVSKGGFNAIVGTAISASLLPPVVNCGICLGLGLVHWTVEANREDARTFINVGGVCYLFRIICLMCLNYRCQLSYGQQILSSFCWWDS